MMKIITERLGLETRGNGDLLDITGKISQVLHASKLRNGTMTIFVIGSTAAITTFEFEPGMIQDVRDMFEKLVPMDRHYHHDDTWGDANGFSHLRASLQGPSLTIPFEDGKLLLGTWQQVVLAEFDNRPRQRRIVVHMAGQ
jgi:secondary thiamine-phosphate synthase enzyme